MFRFRQFLYVNKTLSRKASELQKPQTAAELKRLLQNNKVNIVEFSTAKKMAPVFSTLPSRHPSAAFIEVDVDQLQELSQKYNIKKTPTFVAIVDGKEARRLEDSGCGAEGGISDERIRALVEESLLTANVHPTETVNERMEEAMMGLTESVGEMDERTRELRKESNSISNDRRRSNSSAPATEVEDDEWEEARKKAYPTLTDDKMKEDLRDHKPPSKNLKRREESEKEEGWDAAAKGAYPTLRTDHSSKKELNQQHPTDVQTTGGAKLTHVTEEPRNAPGSANKPRDPQPGDTIKDRGIGFSPREPTDDEGDGLTRTGKKLTDAVHEQGIVGQTEEARSQVTY